jgi:hypothetical protein
LIKIIVFVERLLDIMKLEHDELMEEFSEWFEDAKI